MKKSVVGEAINAGQWAVAIATVLGVSAIFITAVWVAFDWLVKNVAGIPLLEMCSRLGLAGGLVLILLPFALMGLLAGILRPCMDIGC